MALTHGRIFTATELRELLSTPYEDIFREFQFWDLEPTPHMVHYEPVREKPAYVPPDHFYCRTPYRSPSDCDWIVPGTHVRKDF